MKLMTLYLLALVLLASTTSLGSKVTYGELFRPGYHFSAPTDWLNDPIGLVFFNGTYHLYYQYNPDGNDWGNMSWGHATSTDLVYWQNQPVAITDYKDIVIFSGSTIVDVNNTSGFCTQAGGCLLAYYTAHQDSPQRECQAVAYSNDGGISYTQYANNPLIDENLDFFRDPKVVWHDDIQKWIMVTAVPLQFKLRFYSSTDLIKWTFESEFGPEGSTEGGWEDPDLFLLPIDAQGNTKWVLTHAVAVNKVEYYIGEFDGHTFTTTETVNQTLFIDYGKDYCEAASWNNEPNGRRLQIAWLDEGAYGGQLPEKGWRGAHTLIRELSIAQLPEGLRIVQKPLDELAALRTSPTHYDNITVNDTDSVYILSNTGNQMEIIIEFAVDNTTTAQQFGVRVFAGPDQGTIIGYNVSDQVLFVDRSDSGLVDFQSLFSGGSNHTLAPVNGTIKLRIFLDQSSVEVFANDGILAMTHLIFPDPTQNAVELYVTEGSVTATSIDTWLLNSIWSSEGQSKSETFVEALEFLSKLL